jgi:D-methionine transport system ATP-binding protein
MLCDVIGVDLPETFAGLDFHKVAVPGSDVLLRLRFFGDTAAEPVISGLIRRFDVDVNILVARIDHIQNVPYGTLVIELSGDAPTRRQAMNYLEALNLKVEVIGYVAKNIRRAV